MRSPKQLVNNPIFGLCFSFVLGILIGNFLPQLQRENAAISSYVYVHDNPHDDKTNTADITNNGNNYKHSDIENNCPQNIELLEQLYLKYKDDLILLRARINQWRSKPGRQPLYDDVEAEITYLRVRHYRPLKVLECSPYQGYSSTIILQALEDNKFGSLYSFDVQNVSVGNVPEDLLPRWKFHLGDLRDTLKPYSISDFDYFFIDSFHDKKMGSFFIQNVLTKQHRFCPVSYHDVYHPAFYNDNVRGRDLAAHPPDNPTEEGLELMQYLAFSQNAGDVFTLSPTKLPALAKRLDTFRYTNGFSTQRMVGTNPSVFFLLNPKCKADQIKTVAPLLYAE